MGTPQFAAYQLNYLLENNINVAAVITMPDKPMGRGMKLGQSAVKQVAEEKGLPVLQPEKLRDENFLEQLANYRADVFVVVAFRMLPKAVWSMPPMGTLNLHASLLPKYRGAAPINWAIINGENETGVTTFFIQEEIDTGDILLTEKESIAPNDNAGSLHDKLMVLGAKVILKTLKALEQGTIIGVPQRQLKPEDHLLAPKIYKEDCKINWGNDRNQIINHIRGMSPYPTAFTNLQTSDGKIIGLKIFEARPSERILEPGKMWTDGKTEWSIGTKNGSIELQDVQLEGKKRMDIRSFLMGFHPETVVEII